MRSYHSSRWLMFFLIMLPWAAYGSFIETTMGTAVVNDATAAYFNPAALTLLKNAQLIPLATLTKFNTQFTGQTTSVATGFTESGSASTSSQFFSPSFYAGLPLTKQLILGFAAVSNFANRNVEDNALLRYIQSNNTIQDYDFVPSAGFRLNQYFSLGAGINFSYTGFQLHPLFGFPGSNIADSQSDNQSTGSGIGANAGFLLQPNPDTLIGFNYRTVTTYQEKGSSILNGATAITSHNYHFQFRTPARSILSLSHKLTPTFGVISTLQRIEWSIIRSIHIYGIAGQAGLMPIITNASVPYFLHNTWVFTLGAHYRFMPSWIIRIAGTFSQSPDDGRNQISTGDSYIVGTSIGYDVNKTLTIDGSYAHAFIQNQGIQIAGNRFLISGINEASRDAVSLKLTFNV